MFVCKMWILLGEDYESNKFLGADLRETVSPTLLPDVDHKVKDSLTTQNFVAHISA